MPCLLDGRRSSTSHTVVSCSSRFMPCRMVWQACSVVSLPEKAVLEPVPAAQKQPTTAPTRHDEDRSQPLLEVASVSKNFGGVRPANDVTFRLQHGHVHALIGPNGAGKSTMINMISGVLTPSSGRIAFLGNEIGGLESHGICRRGVGRTFPEPAPVRGPFGARERLAWAALPHEERLLGLVTGATTSSPGRGGSERTCNRYSRHPWSSRVGASAGWESSLRVAASRGARTRACNGTSTVAPRRACGWPQPARDG